MSDAKLEALLRNVQADAGRALAILRDRDQTPPGLTEQQAAVFLHRAAYGVSPADLGALIGTDPADWLTVQMSLPMHTYMADCQAALKLGKDHRPQVNVFWDRVVHADDQLRQRMTFALSQIVVASDRNAKSQPLQVAYYVDVLQKHAFGNYRDLLEDLVYTPHMGLFLNYVKNKKGNPKTGRVADEDLAREFLQLFTVGPEELSEDGTPTGGDLYTNEDVAGLAKVFTGLSFAGSWTGPRKDGSDRHEPLHFYDKHHEPGEKSFLGLTIPAGIDGPTSVKLALDHLCAHPNHHLFVSRRLIQRFTASDPSAAYVQRVAGAMDRGEYVAQGGQVFGDGRSGSLAAAVAAILLAPDLDSKDVVKVREPVLLMAAWARAFVPIANAVEGASGGSDALNNSTRLGLGQQPFNAPSVFNWYSDDLRVSGTLTGAQDMTVPELAFYTGSSIQSIHNYLARFVCEQLPGSATFMTPDTSGLPAGDPDHVVKRVALHLCGGPLPPPVMRAITEAAHLIRAKSHTLGDDFQTRVRIIILAIMAAPEFMLVRSSHV